MSFKLYSLTIADKYNEIYNNIQYEDYENRE